MLRQVDAISYKSFWQFLNYWEKRKTKQSWLDENQQPVCYEDHGYFFPLNDHFALNVEWGCFQSCNISGAGQFTDIYK